MISKWQPEKVWLYFLRSLSLSVSVVEEEEEWMMMMMEEAEEDGQANMLPVVSD